MPAFAADYFGSRNVGPIYGLMLTAWGFASAFGPLLMPTCGKRMVNIVEPPLIAELWQFRWCFHCYISAAPDLRSRQDDSNQRLPAA